MNIVRIKKLRDLIATIPDMAFDMGSYINTETKEVVYGPYDNQTTRDILMSMKKRGYTCGTTACLAGWTLTLIPKNKLNDYHVSFEASLWLDLSYEESAKMFAFDGYQQYQGKTKKQALKMLDRAIKTRKVQW